MAQPYARAQPMQMAQMNFGGGGRGRRGGGMAAMGGGGFFLRESPIPAAYALPSEASTARETSQAAHMSATTTSSS